MGLAHEFDTIMLWAASMLCFFGFFRIGEITTPSDASFKDDINLLFRDLAVDNPAAPSAMRVHLKSSKTDQFRRGVDIFIGSTPNELCTYPVCRREHPGALFHFEDGTLLTPACFTEKIRDTLDALGYVSQSYAGHICSFRIGAATTAAERGLEGSLIKVPGRWESDTYLLYVKTPRECLAVVSKILAQD